MERFFSLDHLSTERLRDLYKEVYRVGKQIIEYDQPGEQGHYEIPLSPETIIENIKAGNHNYMAFHRNFEDEPDCLSFAFALSGMAFTRVYVEVEISRLEYFVKNYALDTWRQNEGRTMVEHPFSDFYRPELNEDNWNWNAGSFTLN